MKNDRALICTSKIDKEIESIRIQIENTKLLEEKSLREADFHARRVASYKNHLATLETKRRSLQGSDFTVKRNRKSQAPIRIGPTQSDSIKVPTGKVDKNKNQIFIGDWVRINTSKSGKFAGISHGVVTHLTKKGLLSIEVKDISEHTARFADKVEIIQFQEE